MKRFTTLLLALPLIAGLASSCQEKPQEPKESVKIEGIQDAVTIAAAPEADFSFTIETNVDWSVAKTDLGWLTISPMKGTAKDGVQTISLIAENNQLEETRTGSFTITAGATTKTVSVTQAALVVVPSFAVNGIEANTISFSGEDSEAKTFQVFSNKNWTATKANLDWATVAPVEGDKGRSATITVTPTEVNNTGAERTGTISFAFGAETPFVVSVKQAAFVPALTVDPESLSFAKTGESKTVAISSNTDWTAVSSETWATVSAASGKGNASLSVTAAANEGAERSATVTITAGSIVKTVAVSQESGIVNIVHELETNPVVWCADDLDWNIANNAEYPGPQAGATNYQEGAAKHGTGILKPMSGPSSAYMEFVDAKGADADWSVNASNGKFILVDKGAKGSFGPNGGDIGFRSVWTNDAWNFHVPISQAIPKGKTVCLDFTFLGTGATPKYWIAEIKIGDEWKMMTTGTEEASTGTDAQGQFSNVILKTPDRTHSHYDCTYALTAEIPAGELLVRLRVLDATIRISGSANTSISSTATVRFVGWNSGHEKVKEGHGPTIYVK